VEGKAIPLDHEVYTAIRNYAQDMGASGAHVLDLMRQSSPTEMNYPSMSGLCEVAISTWVQRLC
jgi:hypothetical protein